MRAYRDRPVHPSVNGHLHSRPIDVPTLRPDDPAARQPQHADDAPVAPVDGGPAPAGASGMGAVSDPEVRPDPSIATDIDTGGRPRVLKGQLVVKRLRLRSVAKVALTFYLCLFAVVAVAGTVLWSLANREGWVTGWTGFLVDVGFTDAAVDGPTLARASATAGAIMVATVTMLTVTAAFFYNQLSGLIGGLEVTLASPNRLQRRRRRG